jgi:hypothetical protein
MYRTVHDLRELNRAIAASVKGRTPDVRLPREMALSIRTRLLDQQQYVPLADIIKILEDRREELLTKPNSGPWLAMRQQVEYLLTDLLPMTRDPELMEQDQQS